MVDLATGSERKLTWGRVLVATWGLADWLRERGFTEVDVAGIATDHCVRATAGDAVRGGFGTRVLLGLTAGVAPDTTARALTEMRDAGAELDGTPVLIS